MKYKCNKCTNGYLQEVTGPGRYRKYRDLQDILLPDDCITYKCDCCEVEWDSPAAGTYMVTQYHLLRKNNHKHLLN